MAESKDLMKTISDDFINFESGLNGEKHKYYHKMRREAFEDFSKQGIPTLKHEYWKYANLGFLRRNDFRPALEMPEFMLSRTEIEQHLIKGLDCSLLVFVNGFLQEELSDGLGVSGKLKISSLKKEMEKGSLELEKHLGKYARFDKNPFSSLNTAFLQDGAYILAEKSYQPDKPVMILSICDAAKEDMICNNRNLFVALENSRLDIIEKTVTIGGNAGFSNTLTEIYSGGSSIVNHHIINDDREGSYHIDSVFAAQEKYSLYQNYTYNLSGSFTRNNINTEHLDEHIETNYFGIYLLKDKEFSDSHTFIDHAKPNCQSNEVYKGIVDDMATAVFNGKILVRKDAQKTNAYQSNKNVLLSD
ncbi:MAG: SufB/SufD family protein, partial [Candidatus Kapaibacterium sp.]